MGVLLLLLLLAQPAAAQFNEMPWRAARQWREARERAILDEFFSLLRIPNTGEDPAAMRRNAEAIGTMFRRRGLAVQMLEADDAPPAVYAEYPVDGATQTLVFYAHYDGQPVDPTEWSSGDPFHPTLMSGPLETGGQAIPLPRPGWPSDPEWRIYARSAADNKAAILALATAVEAITAEDNLPRFNLKFFVEGEQHEGSPNLERILQEHRDLLQGDLWVFCDGPVPENGLQQLAFGVRGLAGLDLKVLGARTDLPSDEYSNWAPNPALELSKLLASMVDDDGQVTIEDFYEGIEPLGTAETEALASAFSYGSTLRRQYWLARTEGENRSREEAATLPAINISGITSGSLSPDANNLIPASASASLNVHLVKGMDHRVTVDRIIAHIRDQGYYVTETEPDAAIRMNNPKVCKVTRRVGFNAARTPMALEISRRLISAVESARGLTFKVPTLGNSRPLSLYEEILGTHIAIVPIANHIESNPSGNEDMRLQDLWTGIEVYAAIMGMDDAPLPPLSAQRER